MTTRYESMKVVPFADVTSTTRGVLVKAGLTSNAATEVGIGIGGTEMASLSAIYSAAGVYRTTKVTSGIKLAIPAAAVNSFLTQGSIQFKAKLSELVAVPVADTGLTIYDTLLAGSQVIGPRAQTTSVANTAANNYKKYTSGCDNAPIYGDATAIIGNTNWVIGVDNIFHSQMETDADGYITIRECWNDQFSWWWINGKLSSYTKRKSMAATTVCDNLRILTSLQNVTIKDFLVMSMNGPDPMGSGYRVQLLLHSFGVRCSVLTFDATAGTWWGDALDSWGNPDGFAQGILNTCAHSIKLINTSKAGMTPQWIRQQLEGDTTGGGSFAADGRFLRSTTEVVPRSHPHFVIIGCHFNAPAEVYVPYPGVGSRAGALYTHIMAQCAAAVALRIIPIIYWEQNGNLSGTDIATYDHGVNGTTSKNLAYAVYDAYIAAKALYGDLGFIDMWTPTGGDSVDPSYVENSGVASGRVHKTLKASKLASALGAAEIDRLIATPPAYSNLA